MTRHTPVLCALISLIFLPLQAATLFSEDFENLTLGPNVDETVAGAEVWTKTPPAGWTQNDTGVPAGGITEWRGWSFADKDWWAQAAEDQQRALFVLGVGTVAVADPDEWDDLPRDPGLMTTFLSTPAIDITGISAGSITVAFASSWRPENTQAANVSVSYDGGPLIEILRFDSDAGSPNFKPDAPNEQILIPLNNPAASTMVLTFGMLDAGNNWWWAIDNLEVSAESANVAPMIITQPGSQFVSVGTDVALTVEINPNASAPLEFQWQRGEVDLPGATGPSLILDDIQPAQAGAYRVVVMNSFGTVISQSAQIAVSTAAVTDDLVVHLKFDGTFDDASGRDNHGSAVNSPTIGTGLIGSGCLTFFSAPPTRNYVTLGTPTDLNFGSSTDFSVSYWMRMPGGSLSGDDPAFISNKDWNSGANTGWILATGQNGRLQWNYAEAGSSRKDYDGPGNVFLNPSWHHVLATFHRDGNATVYIDGTLTDTRSIGPGGATIDSGLPTNIGDDGTGAYSFGFGYWVVGPNGGPCMDDLGIWRRRLTPQEAVAIFNAGLVGKDLTQAELGAPQVAPTITSQPQDTTTLAGCTVSLRVVAAGSPPLSYQWKKDGANIPGAVSATYTLPEPAPADAGSYSVEVTNNQGSDTSASVTLTLNPARVTGQWDFSDLSATIGTDLSFFDATVQADTAFGTTVDFGLPEVDGQPAQVLCLTPSTPNWGGYIMTHGVAPNGEGARANCYTLVFDVLYPAAANSQWRTFIQIDDLSNQNDGELFVNPANGIGISGVYSGNVTPNVWHRLVFTVNMAGGRINKYVDGALVGTQNIGSLDGRWALDPTALLFADNDGDHDITYVDRVQVLEGLLTDQEIAELSGVTLSPAGHWNFAPANITGSVVADLAGSTPGTIVGPNVPHEAAGVQAIWLDGFSSHVELAASVVPGQLPQQAITLEAWVVLASSTQYGGIIGAVQDNGSFEKGWVLGYDNSRFNFALSTTGADDGNGLLTYLNADTPYNLAQWYHVVGTYDGITQKIYVNGQLAGTSTVQSGDINYAESAPYAIGAYLDDNEFFRLHGLIREVRVYDTALSASEVQGQFQLMSSIVGQTVELPGQVGCTDPVARTDSPFGNKRVLIIGVDGCRVDSLLAATTPNLDSLAAAGAFSYQGTTSIGQSTVSGPGWSTILTGVWLPKHGVNNNSFTGNNYDTYPHFFTRLRELHPDAFLSSIVNWSPINASILRDETFELRGLSDAQVGAQAACHILNSGPDAIFLHFDELDGAGHGGGYHPGNANYLATLNRIDGYIGTVLAAVQQRETLLGEDWLIIFCSDHGGTPGGGHGGQSLDEVRVPLIVKGGRTQAGEILPNPFNTDIVPTLYAHLGVEVPAAWSLDGQTVAVSPLMRMTFDGATATIRWPGIANLQRSQGFSDWTDVAEAVSPFSTPVAQPSEFFQLAP